MLVVPDSVPFRPTSTVSLPVAASETGKPAPKGPFAIGLKKHEFITVGSLKRDDAPNFSPEALARLESVAPPELPKTIRDPSNVKSLAFSSLHSFLQAPSFRRWTNPDAQPSAQRVTRAAPNNSTVPISQETKGVITGANDIGVKTAAFSGGRHSFLKFGG